MKDKQLQENHILEKNTRLTSDRSVLSRFVLGGRTQNAEPYSMEYPMEYLKWSTPKNHVLVK